jgi:dihydrolipoamide dehydrogenase
MSQQASFDVCIIGGGPGGYVAAIRAAQLGLRVALVERRQTLGGTCLNVGCIPSKALLDSSERYAQARTEFGHHGIRVEGLSLDLPAMMERKDRIVRQLAGGIETLLRHHDITILAGHGSLRGPGAVSVSAATGDTRVLAARAVVLATGSAPAELPFLPFDHDLVIDSTDALSLAEVPRRLVVVGGGAIGVEMASIWSRLGSAVTILELLPRLLPSLDSQVSSGLARAQARQGIAVHTQTAVKGLRRGRGRPARLAAEGPDGKAIELGADAILVATGRRPYTENLGLETVGIALDPETRQVPVDAYRQTVCPGIYAIGDIVRGPMLAHKAEEEGVAVAERLAGMTAHVDEDLIPWVVYSRPEVAGVGRTEDTLKATNTPYRAGVFSFMANGRALAADAAEGFVKVLAAKDSDRVLGVSILGPAASELIAEAVTVMAFGGSAEDVARTVHAHPTFSEAVREAALDVDGRALHAVRRKSPPTGT